MATNAPSQLNVEDDLHEYDAVEPNEGDNDKDIAEFLENVPDSTMDAKEKDKFKVWLRNAHKRPVGIFITGKSGSGKSTLLNALFGVQHFPEGNTVSKHCTEVIEEHRFMRKGAKFVVWDSPGLQDGTKSERKYLANLKKSCSGNADLMLYCINVSQTRAANEFSAVHDAAIVKVTKTLGRDIWKHTLVVLTFANKLEEQLRQELRPDNSESSDNSSDEDNESAAAADIDETELKKRYDERIEDWKVKFQEALQNKAKVSKEIAERACVFPAGFRTHPSLPGHEHWFSDFWTEMMLVANKNAHVHFIEIAKGRMKTADEAKDATYGSDKFETPIILTEKVQKILISGTIGTAAAVAGSSIGATIGAMAIGVVSFGPATGLVLIGAVAGVGIGALKSLFTNHKKKVDDSTCGYDNLQSADSLMEEKMSAQQKSVHYFARVYCYQLNIKKHQIVILVSHTQYKTFISTYSNRDWNYATQFEFQFKESDGKLSFVLPKQDKLVGGGWKITPTVLPCKVERKDIHRDNHFRCTLLAHWEKSGDPSELVCVIGMRGVTKTHFQISIDPQLYIHPSVPQVRDSFKLLLPMADLWPGIATLIGLKGHQIQAIRSDNPTPNDALRAVLSEWLSQAYPRPSWRDIANAVELLGNKELAKVLIEKRF